ncbi:MAG: hypothetical protein ACOC58_04980 [Chloroflexota bacterium]
MNSSELSNGDINRIANASAEAILRRMGQTGQRTGQQENPGGAEEPFIGTGQRVRYIGSSKYRHGDWPEGAWIQYGATGTVTEYQPGYTPVVVRGEHFEGLEPWAVVTWDFGGTTAILAEDEGRAWERARYAT